MNKKFTKLMAALALLTFLAAPLGMWGQSIEINTENFTKPNSGSGYAAYDGTRTIGGVDITSSNVMVQSGNLQFKKSSGYLYNSTAMPGNITKITLATATNFTIYVSTTANTETQSVTSGSAISGNYTYFKVKTGSSTGTTASITIEYSTGGSTTYTLTYDCNGGTSGCPQNVTGIELDEEITLADAPSKTGHAFDGWNDGTLTYDAGDSYTVSENVTMTAQWTAYTITAQSNNTSYGTVSLDGFTITASPASGCRYASPAYSVSPANSATVDQNGNTFTVTPTANTMVTINFEEIPTHDATFSVNGTTSSTQVAEGAAITFPADPANIDEMVFMGWTDAPINGTQSEAPNFVTSATMGTSDVTFYAVFATADASGEPVETKSQTLQYDTWSYSGSTTDKSSYRLFHSGSYIESAAFDLSKLSKVIVYGGTFGGSSYNSLTIGDGTNVWKNVTVSGSSQTGLNTYTGGTALSGTKPLRIISNSGTASGTGIRISKVEIYTLEPSIVYSDYCTTVEVSTDPSVTVTPSTINAPFAGADGTLAITYENITEIISFDYYFCDADGNELEDTDPDYPGDWIYAEINEENDAYTLDYTIDANDGEVRSAYMKVYTFDDNEEEVSAIVTVNQAEYVAPSYADLPFEYNDGKSAIEEADGLSQEGLGSDYDTDNTKLKFDDTGDWLLLQFNERPGTLTFDIKGNGFSNSIFTVQTSVDGETYDDLVLYIDLASTETTKEINTLDADVRYIKWIYSQKAIGNVGIGNIKLAAYTAPVPEASITVNPDEVNMDAEEHDGTLDLAYESLTITDMTDFNIQFCDANGDELSEQPDWIEVLVAEQDPTIGEGYVVSYYMVENEGTDARTAYFKVYAMDDETNLVYSNLVTISQAAPVVPPTPSNWVLTDLADLTADDVFVIVGNNGNTYAMSNGNGTSAAPAAVAVTVAEGTLSGEPDASLQWNISITNDGYTFYPNGETETWLYCTNTNNGVRVGTNENNVFTMSENGYLHNTATERYIGIYNSQDWRCYTNTTGNIAGQTFSFYKEVVEPATETYELAINGYGSSTTEGWNLIASPVSTTPDQVGNMLTNETEAPYSYDLYRFNQAAESEWENYHQHSGDFNIVPGTGYLYANKGDVNNTPNTVTLTFTGVPYSGDGEIELVYSTDNSDSKMHGWNLVGNPFDVDAEIRDDYYMMNEEGSELIANDDNIVEAMQGVFVQATAAGQTVIFYPQSRAKSNDNDNKVVINISRNRGIIVDRAVVRFGEGRQLPKMQLFENSTKLYITQDNKDYAVVRTEAQGEMPVNFKAAENGTYTLTVNPEGVEMNYLHLIDNMTGADIDLLAATSTGSVATYTFNARTTDYSSRFRLVFAANNEDGVSTGSTAFAFYSNGTWVINNTGEATLQVVDVNGRILSSETVNGSVSKAINAPAGVYMLRLINGNDVKTQKIVVR